MSYLPQLLTLAAVLLLACISPGPDFIAVTSHALASRRRGLGVALGVAAACVVWASLAMFGLGVLLVRISWLYEAIRVVGALYLIYLGAKLLLSARKSYGALTVEAVEGDTRFAPRIGLLVGLTNPKSAAFFGSLFVTVLPVGAPLWVQGATLAIVALVAGGWFTLVAYMFSAKRVRSLYARVRRPIDAVMGAILVGLGVHLAASR
ncbi:LysE family translocator [Segnochrobactrum spirostomi]|uniref:Lysine transporter LysE n=1 Tax=Segnochrobactrum spirostomi TaxID=2608987 RepID=A0A6A7Y0X9_9HYPH|nr:LysE family transporter [Segnochrobactrum spirostomi]MQT12037.1 lysine transporter LysE [Segnochrobactrum spirostomi]